MVLASTMSADTYHVKKLFLGINYWNSVSALGISFSLILCVSCDKNPKLYVSVYFVLPPNASYIQISLL